MTTDFRALCAALLDEISHESPTTCLARAALAEPQPNPPADGEVGELVAWLLEGGEDAAANGWDHQARQFGRAAELLQRLKPEPPTDDGIIPDCYLGYENQIYRDGFHAGYRYALSTVALAKPQPEPPSLKQQALKDFDALMSELDRDGNHSNCTERIRRALEQLDD